MAGNSQRRGATRKSGSKKGPTVGSGGQRRQALEGRGPTPKATERPGHPAARKATAKAGRAGRAGSGGVSTTRSAAATRGVGRAGTGRGTRRPDGAPELVAGRNPVVEALREHVPAKALYV